VNILKENDVFIVRDFLQKTPLNKYLLVETYDRLQILKISPLALGANSCGQGRRKVDNWGGADIHIFMFTDCKNNRFQRT
jgi:hypothetical protein